MLAVLVFGMALVSATHAVEVDEHIGGEICEVCVIPGIDGGALPLSADQPQFDLQRGFGITARLSTRATRAIGSAQPRAPPIA